MRNDLPDLTNKAADLVKAARKAGADKADAAIIRSRSYSAGARLGKIEDLDSAESDDFALRVFVGQKAASISANLAADLDELAARAVAMAKVSPENPFEAEVEKAQTAQNPRDLDLFDDFAPDMERLSRDALELEAAALAVKGITNSGGASASYGIGGMVLATSEGFCGAYSSTYFGRSVSAVAGEGAALERDYDYSSARYYADMDSAAEIGARAGRQAAARLGARQALSGRVDVIFAPRVARSLAGHLAACVNGAAIARKTGLLQNHMGKRIMRAGVDATDNPLRLRGAASFPFDAEGVEPQPLSIVEDGILAEWLLSSSAARELGLKTNGRGARAGNSVAPSSSNFAIEAGDITPESLIGGMKSGFYVIELVGHGVDLISGQYSRGAAGFWVENGAFAYPVSEVTLASDLLHIFGHMLPADDLDRRFATAAPTVLVEGMMLAGK